MKCPKCGSDRVRVYRTQDWRDHREIKRERHCEACSHAWHTLEIHEALLKRLPPTATNSTSVSEPHQ